MANTIVTETLPNGLVVIVEEIPHLESVAYSLNVPSGIIADREDRVGSSLVLAELTARGAGKLTSQELMEAFDAIGARHGEGAGMESTSYTGSLLSENLDQALQLVSLMAREPTLPEGDIPSIKSLLLQDIQGLYDNPARRVMVELGKRYYPGAYGRPGQGTEQGIEQCTLADLKSEFAERFTPQGAILSIAGKVKGRDVIEMAKRHFGSWQGKKATVPAFGQTPPLKAHHIATDAAQLQIALAYPAARFVDEHYYSARVATQILSGGMFGRLFIEVREKRGLVYSVYASHSATGNHGAVFVYAGTTPERAQETLDVAVKELRSLAGSVTDEELKRAKVNLRSSLIMAQESASSRAGSNAGDWWWLKRVRTLDEIEEGIAAVDAAKIDSYIKAYPPKQMMLMTLGSKELSFAG